MIMPIDIKTNLNEYKSATAQVSEIFMRCNCEYECIAVRKCTGQGSYTSCLIFSPDFFLENGVFPHCKSEMHNSFS